MLLPAIPSDDEAMLEALAAVSNLDIERAESLLFGMPQVDCPVIHKFAPGLYIREIHLKAGAIVVGNHQKLAHLNLFLQGKVQMIEAGLVTTLLTAPMQFVSPPGRKVGYIVEDVIWQNIYATEETDVAKLEEMFFEKSATALSYHQWRLQALRDFYACDRKDYAEKMHSLGITEEEIQREVQDTTTLCDYPTASVRYVQVADSPIHGKGLFASRGIGRGEYIAVASVKGKRTPAGRYTNHAKAPNARLEVLTDGSTALIATQFIAGSRGGMLGDEVTIDYLETLKTTGRIPKDFLCHQQLPQQ